MMKVKASNHILENEKFQALKQNEKERFVLLADHIFSTAIRNKSLESDKPFAAPYFVLKTLEAVGFEVAGKNPAKLEKLVLFGVDAGFWKYTPGTGWTNKRDFKPGIIEPSGKWLNPLSRVDFQFKTKPVIKALTEVEKMKVIKNTPNEDDLTLASATVRRAHTSFDAFCRRPTTEELIEVALELVSNPEITPKTKEKQIPYIFDYYLDNPKPNLMVDIVFFENVKTDYTLKNWIQDEKTGGKVPGRSYTWFSLTPSWIREQVTINGEKITGLDASALHPNILAGLMGDAGIPAPDFLKGDSHSKIAKILGISRASAKLINLSYWNTNKNEIFKSSTLIQVFHKLISKDYPEVLAFINKLTSQFKFLNKEGKPAKPHTHLFRIFCLYETVILSKVIDKLKDLKIPADSVYDCIYIPESEKEIGLKFFNETLSEMGFATEAGEK